MRIDAHQHFWHYSAAEYDWIDDSMAMLRRDFLPADLLPLRAARGIHGTVAVQARQSLAETRWLCELARQHPWILGVVGWVDLGAADCERQLLGLAAERRLCGVRHVLQAEPADFALRPDFQRGVALLAGRGLCYDVLVKPPQLPAAIELCRRFPQQTFVLDHLGKPDVRGGERRRWSEQLRELARLPNVACKLSGLATEADWANWTLDTLRPYVDVALAAFGPQRLLFGSDWPVCLLATGYERWCTAVEGFVSDCSPAERAAIFGDNAARLYRLAAASARA